MSTTWHSCTDTALRTIIKGTWQVCIITNGSSSLHGTVSSVSRSDFISRMPRITLPGRHRMWWEWRADERKTTTKRDVWMRMYVRGRKGMTQWWRKFRLMIMNVTLSSLLYDPGVFANHPDSQRSGPSLLPTGEKLSSSAKRRCSYRNHQGLCLQPEILTLGIRARHQRSIYPLLWVVDFMAIHLYRPHVLTSRRKDK